MNTHNAMNALLKLEDTYRDYRDAVANGLCADEPAIHAMFKRDIAAAREQAIIVPFSAVATGEVSRADLGLLDGQWPRHIDIDDPKRQGRTRARAIPVGSRDGATVYFASSWSFTLVVTAPALSGNHRIA